MNPKGILCGNAKHKQVTYHPSVADVKACYSSVWLADVENGDATMEEYVNSREADIVDGLNRQNVNSAIDRFGRQAPHPSIRTHEAREARNERIATDPQMDFISKLLRDRDTSSIEITARALQEQVDLWLAEGETHTISLRSASAMIRTLKGLKYRGKSAVQAGVASYIGDNWPDDVPLTAAEGAVPDADDFATEDGIYRHPETGEFFKGQFNRAQGDGRRLYFKRLVITKGYESTDLDWVYAGSPRRAGVLTSWRVTREEAEQFGRLYGRCIRCHRELTLEESIDRAMGQTCARKMGWN